MSGEGTVHGKNFEQVDELQPDAINLTLVQKGDGQIGIIAFLMKSALLALQ
jgi:hypothetical protein